jgi:hypothetical protein
MYLYSVCFTVANSCAKFINFVDALYRKDIVGPRCRAALLGATMRYKKLEISPITAVRIQPPFCGGRWNGK